MGKWPGVRIASESSIEIYFYFRGVRCWETFKLPATATNMQWAANKRGGILDSIAKGTFDYVAEFPDSSRARLFAKKAGDVQMLEAALEDWLESARKRVEKSTYEDWRNSIRNTLIPQFGKLRLAELRKHHVRAWIDTTELSRKRISNILTPLRQCLAQATEDEVIDTNPMADFKTTLRKVDKALRKEDPIDPFTPEELRAVCKHLTAQAENYAVASVWTGLRPEEMIELHWADVDFGDNVINVRRARTRGEAKAPKTQAGKRQVKLLPPALEALKSQMQFTYMGKAHVFHDPRTGQPYLGTKQFREWQWRPACREAEVRYRPPKQLRHTFASWMLGAGENIMWVSATMGHNSVKMTLDVYGRFMPSLATDAGKKAMAIWRGDQGAQAREE